MRQKRGNFPQISPFVSLRNDIEIQSLDRIYAQYHKKVHICDLLIHHVVFHFSRIWSFSRYLLRTAMLATVLCPLGVRSC